MNWYPLGGCTPSSRGLNATWLFFISLASASQVQQHPLQCVFCPGSMESVVQLPPGSTEFGVNIKFIHIDLGLGLLHNALQFLEAACIVFFSLTGLHSQGGPQQGAEYSKKLSGLDDWVMLDHLVVNQLSHTLWVQASWLGWNLSILTYEVGTRSSIDDSDLTEKCWIRSAQAVQFLETHVGWL